MSDQPPPQQPPIIIQQKRRVGCLSIIGGIVVVAIIGVIIAAVAGGGGSGDKEHTVSYEVTGTATSVSTTYRGPTGDSAQAGAQPVPWRHTQTMKGRAYYYLSGQNQGDSGTVICTVYVDGVAKESNSSTGPYTICQVSGTIE